MKPIKTVPYSTTDDESQWSGHIWRMRRTFGEPWGFAWEVLPPYAEEPVAQGWRASQAEAENAMMEILQKYRDARNDDR